MDCCLKKDSASLSETSSAVSTNQRRLTTPDGIPTFEAVLTGEVALEPWAPKTFLDFLHAEHNDENFFFFQETEAFKALKGKTVSKPPPEDFLILPGSVRSDVRRYVHEIVKTFVQEDAPRQVNISATQREKLLEDVKAALEAQGYDDSVFEEAQNEVKRLMQQDSWPRFKQKMLTTNIDNAGRMSRLHEGLFIMFLVVLTLALMLGFQAPRWYIFLLFVPIYLSLEAIIAYKLKFCPRLGLRGLRARLTGDSTLIIVCPIVKGRAKHIVRKSIAMNIVLTSLLTGFFFALTYIIEAGTGRTMYG